VIDDDSIIESATLAVSADDSAVVGVSAESPEVGKLDTVGDVRIGSSTVVASSPLTPTNVVVAGAASLAVAELVGGIVLPSGVAGAGVGARAFAVSSIVMIAGTDVEVDFVVGGDVGVVPTVVVEVVEVVVVADVVVVVVAAVVVVIVLVVAGVVRMVVGTTHVGPLTRPTKTRSKPCASKIVTPRAQELEYHPKSDISTATPRNEST